MLKKTAVVAGPTRTPRGPVRQLRRRFLAACDSPVVPAWSCRSARTHTTPTAKLGQAHTPKTRTRTLWLPASDLKATTWLSMKKDCEVLEAGLLWSLAQGLCGIVVPGPFAPARNVAHCAGHRGESRTTRQGALVFGAGPAKAIALSSGNDLRGLMTMQQLSESKHGTGTD